MSRILIAGMGNVLRSDDGFGVEIARLLKQEQVREGSPLQSSSIKVVEVGIGGIHLVQELMDGYETLIVIDAVERGGSPGQCYVLEAEVPNLEEWPMEARQDFLADMHYTTPSRALILAKGLGVLPPRVFIVGCQPSDVETFEIGLSQAVSQAAGATLRAIEQLISGTARSAGSHQL